MTGSLPPPGWYPDPSNHQQLRWWTGERWTGAVRPIETVPPGEEPTTAMPVAAAERTAPVAGAAVSPETGAQTTGDTVVAGAIAAPAAGPWTRERKIAAMAIGGLLLTSLMIWLVAVVLQRGDDGVAAPTTLDGAVDDDQTGDGDEAAGSGAEEDADDAGEDDDGDAAADDDATDEDEVADDEVLTIDFDGACTVEVEAGSIEDGEELRPWQFDECGTAPVDPDAGDGSWIVVVASVDGAASEAEAQERADGYGDDVALLWSSHYPSLNPGWWVVYDGPFPDEDAAEEAADARGGGSYARVLSDDDGDRYCIAADGC